MKTDAAVSRRASAAEKTSPSIVSEKVLIGLNEPIDVNFDHTKENSSRKKIERENQYENSNNVDYNEKKNGKTLVAIALMTIFLFLLAGLSIKFTNSNVNTSLAALFGSSSKITANSDTSVITVDDAYGSLSDILSSKISLISSKNPKFIVTKDGKKIEPSDTIDGSLTVIDILADHILVTSNGSSLKIAY